MKGVFGTEDIDGVDDSNISSLQDGSLTIVLI